MKLARPAQVPEAASSWGARGNGSEADREMGQADPYLWESLSAVPRQVLQFCVSKEIRDMWAALTSDVEGAPADDYPSDIDIDSKEEAEFAKKREWHFEWLETVISYYGTNH